MSGVATRATIKAKRHFQLSLIVHQSRVKRPLLARVPSLVRFFDNPKEITCMKERVVEFFFTETVNTVV